MSFYENADDHFHSIGTIADRIICATKQEIKQPLLSLSFLKVDYLLKRN